MNSKKVLRPTVKLYVAVVVFASLIIVVPFLKVYYINEFKLDKYTIIFWLGLISSGLISVRLFQVLSLIAIIHDIITLHIIREWGVWLIGNRLSVAFESPGYEMSEYFSTYVKPQDVSVVLMGFLFWVFISYTVNKLWVRPSGKLRILGLVYVLLVAPVALYAKPERLDVHPYSVVFYEAISAYHRVGMIAERKAYLASRSSINSSACSSQFNNIIIVLGESVNRDRMHVYGYNSPNTPFFDQLVGEDSAVNVSAISPADTTNISIPMIFTDASPKNFKGFFHSEGLVGHFRKCGWTTYWISNQASKGKFNTYVSSVASEAEFKRFSSNWNDEDDRSIVDIFVDAYRKTISKGLFVLHLKGSHFAYNERYPKDYRKDFSDENPLEQYDKSILFTDEILRKIYSQIESDKDLLIYLSDHGEVVTNDIQGHGLSPGYKDEYKIPLVFVSRKQGEWRGRLKEITAEKNFNASDFKKLVLYVSGLEDAVNFQGELERDKVLEVSEKNTVSYSQLMDVK